MRQVEGHDKQQSALRVLVVGQTPPPWHGQAILIDRLLSNSYHGVRLFHVPMRFSQEIADIGRPRPRKVIELARVLFRIYRGRFALKPHVLYYPPAGPDAVPVIRDVILLLATRWLFPHIVFDFHAGGLSELLERAPRWVRPLTRAAYFRPDLAIQVPGVDPDDGAYIRAKQIAVVPRGIPDAFSDFGPNRDRSNRGGPVQLLFVGSLRESKGVLVLLEACAQLVSDGYPIRLRLVGSFVTPEFRTAVEMAIASHGLTSHVEIAGRLTGREKWLAYANADVFCFPSFYESETFGIALLEAMQFELPVVAAEWRGVSIVIEDGNNGFLAPPRDHAAFASHLAKLVDQPDLRRRMGEAGRQMYLDRYTEEKWLLRMEEAFLAAAGRDG